ncbi:MAG TPA: hypothetical protein VL359_05840, partial [bacterium]|nr:hypothetical protein [bacterium]
DPRRTGGMEFELTDWVTHAREENLRARAHLAHLARRLARKGFTVRTTFAEGRPREAVRALLRAPTPAAVVVHGRPRAEHRHALDHGIRRVLLAAGGWLVVVPAG